MNEEDSLRFINDPAVQLTLCYATLLYHADVPMKQLLGHAGSVSVHSWP